VAAVLLLVGGAESLGALQAMTVSTGLPFTIVLSIMCYSTWVGLNQEAKKL
jgi:betaine/carnitine transporter, BCCT family